MPCSIPISICPCRVEMREVPRWKSGCSWLKLKKKFEGIQKSMFPINKLDALTDGVIDQWDNSEDVVRHIIVLATGKRERERGREDRKRRREGRREAGKKGEKEGGRNSKLGEETQDPNIKQN